MHGSKDLCRFVGLSIVWRIGIFTLRLAILIDSFFVGNGDQRMHRGAVFLHHTARKENDSLTEFLGKFLSAGKHQNSFSVSAVNSHQQFNKFFGLYGIQIACGFIGNNDPCTACEGSCQSHSLLIERRQLTGGLRRHVSKLYHFQRSMGFRPHVSGSFSHHAKGKGYIFKYRLFGKQSGILENNAQLPTVIGHFLPLHRANIHTVYRDVTCGRLFHASQKAENRGFSRFGRSNEEHEFTCGDLQTQFLQRGKAAIVYFVYILKFNHCIAS